MKIIFCQILFLSFFPFIGVGQTDSTIVSDTIHSEADFFIKSIAKIEFVKIEPICTKQKRYIDSLGRKKKVNICHAQSVLICVQIIGGELKCDINLTRLSEKVELDKDDYDLLFGIIYKSEKVNYLDACYNPRHGILIYNEDNEQIEFIEICFECDRSISTSGIPDFGLMSHKSYKALHDLFEKYGF